MLSAPCLCHPGLTTSVCSSPEPTASTCISLEAFPKVGEGYPACANGSQRGWTGSTPRSSPEARTNRSRCINTPVPVLAEQDNSDPCSHGFPEFLCGIHAGAHSSSCDFIPFLSCLLIPISLLHSSNQHFPHLLNKLPAFKFLSWILLLGETKLNRFSLAERDFTGGLLEAQSIERRESSQPGLGTRQSKELKRGRPGKDLQLRSPATRHCIPQGRAQI